MNRLHISLIFITLLIAGFSIFSFVNNIQADTSGTVIMKVKISVCGNGILEGGEQCDGDDNGGKACSYLGYRSGALECTASCEFDVSNCNTTAEENVAAIFNVFVGGSQTLHNGEQSVTVELPADFYSDSLRLEMFSYSSTTIADLKPAPSGEQFLSKIYDLNFFDSSGNSVPILSEPATVTLVYADSDVNQIIESSIKPYKFRDDDSSWNSISESTLDTENNTVTFTTQSFGRSALLGSVPISTDAISSPKSSSIGRGRRLVYLPQIADKNITDYIDSTLSILDFSNNGAENAKNTEKNVKQNEGPAEKSINNPKTSKKTYFTIKSNDSLNDYDKNVTESKLKAIITSLVIIYVILMRLAILL
jgi:hypothetical protein